MLPVLEVGPFRFFTFGLVVGASICLGWYVFARYFREHGLAVKEWKLGLSLVVCGLIGAKLDNLIVVQHALRNGHGFGGPLLANLSGGYTYLGSVMGGLVAGAVYVQLSGLPWLRMFDAMFCLGPAYALGRVGCFLAGDGDYGVVTRMPWGVSFPHGVVPTLERVHPTMLYCTVWEMAVFAVLWRLASRVPALRPGILLGLYLVLSGVGRFAVELVSRNGVVWWGLKEAQIVSLVMMGVGVGVLAWVIGGVGASGREGGTQRSRRLS